MTRIARRGLCLVVSAPSGAGKTAITRALLDTEPRLQMSVSVTTRNPRPGEIDGVHYHFLSETAFAESQREGRLLEWARVLGGAHAYGTPRRPVEQALAAGEDVVFDIDWQGERQLRARLGADLVSIFILPPSLRVLEERLRSRAGDEEVEIERRMRMAQAEISHWPDFDHVVINDDLNETIASVRAILHAARSTTARQVGMKAFVEGLV